MTIIAESARITRLKRHVLAGGGVWVGIQEALTPDTPSLALFNSPTTGSTLALPDDERFDSREVHEKIEASDKLFGKGRFIKVHRATAEIFLNDLKEVVGKFEGLRKRGE